jgi:hypothetical protein
VPSANRRGAERVELQQALERRGLRPLPLVDASHAAFRGHGELPSAAAVRGGLDELASPLLVALVVDHSEGQPGCPQVTKGLVVPRIAAAVAIGGHVNEIGALPGGGGELDAERQIARHGEMPVLVVPVAQVQPSFDVVGLGGGEGALEGVDDEALLAQLPRRREGAAQGPISTATSYWITRSRWSTARAISSTSSAIADS